MSLHLGIDIGGTALKVGLCTDRGQILSSCQEPIGIWDGPEAFVARLAALGRALTREAGAEPSAVLSVGVGVPGIVENGQIVNTCNLPLHHVPFETLFRHHWSLPVTLDNDANCAAWGEYRLGAGVGSSSFLMLTLGTGIGAGFILNGTLCRGAGGTAGEVGHMVIARDGFACSCGRHGCWEQYASATALLREGRRTMMRHPDSLLYALCENQPERLNGELLFHAAVKQDTAALFALETYRNALALGLVNLANILKPEIIAIGGGISEADEALLLLPVQAQFDREVFAPGTALRQATLGNQAGVLGAALLSMQPQ